MQIAWLSPGGLFLRSDDGTVRALESQFAEGVRSRHQSMARRNAWKGAGREGPFASSQLLWGASSQDPAQLRIALTSISALGGQLLYSIDADGLDAICSISTDDFTERRLMHGSERRLRHLSADADGSRIACSVGHRDGTANIAVMKRDASDLAEVTEGESVDLAPSWIPGRPTQLVYQSAGLGRNSAGLPVALSPFSVHRLDLARGELEVMVESPTEDFLGPKMDAAGTLYAIRRPTPTARKVSPLRVLLDIVAMPFRIAWALFQYLNFFTTRYTGKPLTTAGGPRREGADLRQMMIWGNLIDADKAARESEADGGEPPSVVPKSWELVARRSDGAISIVARGVISFDLAADKSLCWSTGSAIYLRDPSGRTERIVEGDRIEQVAVLR